MLSNSLPKLGDQDFRRLQQMMQETSGIFMAEQKRTLVAGRLMCRLRSLELSNYGDYMQLLEQPQQQEERRMVIDLLTTNETYFFREPQHFQVLGDWLAQQRAPQKLWSAASSSGEEAYSMAMIACERAKTDWSIFASDLSRRVLDQARTAIYKLEQAHKFPPGWLERHCLRGIGDSEGMFRVGPSLRQRVSFAEINLTRALPQELSKIDVIFLRNVLIYFATDEKRAIVTRLVERLRPGGLLFIGHAESLYGFDLPLRTLRPSVFERL